MAMAAIALRVPFSSLNPNPSCRYSGGLVARLTLPSPGNRRAAVAAGLGPRKELVFCGSSYRRHRSVCLVGHAAQDGETDYPDIKVESTDSQFDEDNESEKAWRQALESFKDNALKMQSVSQEAYDIYSKKAMTILEETSKNMMIQADKASRDISEIVKEVSEEGSQFIVEATAKSPDSVKEIVELFTSPEDDLKDLSNVRDFHVGISYGALLAVVGFASFMFTGSTAAIRFGIILGSVLFVLAIFSFRAWRSGKTSQLFLKSQTAVAAIIFIREWRLFFQRSSLPSVVTPIISGAVVAFYVYRIIVYHQSERRGLDYGSDD